MSGFPRADVQVQGLSLRSARFERLGSGQLDQVQVEFGIGFARLGRAVLGVELRLEMEQEGVCRIAVAYRGTFERQTPFEEDEDELTYWQHIASRVATIVLFPYLRAEVSHLVMAARMPDVLVPLVNPAELFDPETLEIPDFVEEGASEE